MLRKHFLVSGKVQGVGFRRFVHTQGVALGLLGAVRNLDDGRVEILVQGEAQALQDFERLVRQGPPHGKVLDVVARALADGDDKTPGAVFSTGAFAVLEDGESPWPLKDR